jgi:hypothetical protein
MPRSTLALVALLAAASLPAPLLAQSGLSSITRSVRVLDKNFDVADANHDGKLSLQEAQAGPVPFIAHHFAAIDSGHAGLVSKQDVHAYIVRMLTRSHAPRGVSSTGTAH